MLSALTIQHRKSAADAEFDVWRALGLLCAAHMQTIEKRRVLVVDDQPNVTDLVRLFLEKTNRYTVFVQNVSHSVLATAKQVKPHLFILDVDMPGKDGGDVARELSESREFATTPVLFFTSLISPSEAGKRETERGGKKFLAKPIDARSLVEAVDRNCAQDLSVVAP